MAINKKNSVAYIALVVMDETRKGIIIHNETIEYTLPKDNCKYWCLMKACRQVLLVIDKLVSNRVFNYDTIVKVIVPSKVFIGWMEKGKAVEPYRYAFDNFLRDCENAPCGLEFIYERLTSSNRASCYADASYVPKEKYQSVLEVYANA